MALPFETPKAIEIIEAYARDHPLAFSELSSLFLGEHMKPDNDALQRLAKKNADGGISS